MNYNFEYVFVKDMHLMYNFRNNIRKPGWEKAIDDKLQQILDYMKINKIEYLFTAGDIFDKSIKKQWSFSQFQANMERLRWFKEAGIKIYSNRGNHDLSNGGRESIEDTIFEMAVDLGLLNYIGTGMEPIRFPVDDLGEVLLFGVDYHVSTDKVLDEIKLVSAYPHGQQSSKICLMHSNITSDTERLTDFTYDQLSVNDIDVIGCGHYHMMPSGGSIQEVGGTHFLNPFNLTRVTREYSVKLDEHKPEFIHSRITFLPESDPIYDFKEIFLNVGKFSETFNVDLINMLQELGKDRFAFFDEVGLDGLEEDEDINDDELLLDTLAKTQEISKDSVKIAKELLT